MSEPDPTNVDMAGTEEGPPSDEPIENATLAGDEDDEMSVDGAHGDMDSLFGDDPPDDDQGIDPSANANMHDGAQDERDQEQEQEEEQELAQEQEEEQELAQQQEEERELAQKQEQERDSTQEDAQVEHSDQIVEDSQAEVRATSPIDGAHETFEDNAQVEEQDQHIENSQVDEQDQPTENNQADEQDQHTEDSQQPVRETSPSYNQQDVSAELEDQEMDQDDEDGQDMVRESIEQQVDPDTQSMDLSPSNLGTANQRKETEDRNDEIMSDAGHETEEIVNPLPDEIPETEIDADAMEDVQIHANAPSGFQQAYAEDQQPDEESLFVPEVPRQTAQPPSTPAPAPMAPPPPPLRTPTVAGNSTFAKIRNMQKRLAEKKNEVNKQSRRYNAEPDPEDYLNVVMSPITPSPSAPRPTVDEDEMADRQALAEFNKQKKYYDGLKHKFNGSLPFRQDVEWMKIKGAEDARKLKRKRDLKKAAEDHEDDPDLFPDVRPRYNAEDDQEETSADEGNVADSAASRKRRRDMPRKEPKQASMQQAELHSMMVAVEAMGDMPKKKKAKGAAAADDSQSASTTGKGKSKAPAKPKPRAPRPKAAPKSNATSTAAKKRATETAIRQATSLFNSNVFEQQAGVDEADQPTFRARRKQDALKELIASVPIGDEKQARSDMSQLLAATKDFDGRGSVKAAGGNWLVKGMKTSLKGYQIMGSAFMRRRENSMDEPKGGLMADQMGLGKTLMMLANIVNGQPAKGAQGDRTTLLVAGPALLTQWGNEIEQHTDCGLKVMRYGAGNRIDSNATFEVLKHHDIILTTYGEVMKSYPKNEPPVECQTVEEKIEWWKETFETRRGVLHRMKFLRIVLDEAQAIKNYQGRTSIACRALMADHKWALSGTPIMNSLTELYPYFKFLGVPHTGTFKIFKHNYCDTNDAENTERLLVRLSQFMIRRTHADRMFNAPILKLPQADQGTFWCNFNSVERKIYDIVRKRFVANINVLQKKGELDKSYSNVLVLLLRLRQLTAHVLMLQFVMKDLLEVEDIELIKDVVNEEAAKSPDTNGRNTIVAIRKQLEKHANDEKKKAAARAKAKADAKAKGLPLPRFDEEDEAARAPPDGEQPEEGDDDEPSQHTGGASRGGSGNKFGQEYNFKPFLETLKTGDSWEKAKKRARCSWCHKNPKQPYIADCGHLICESPCLEMSAVEAAEIGKDQAPCKNCGVTPKHYIPFEKEQQDEFFDPVATGTRSKTAGKAQRKKDAQERVNPKISEDWLNMVGTDVLPSAKTMAIKAQILNWRKEDPNAKIIIYTQFLAMVKIMAKIFQMEGWRVEQYIGTMSLPARDKAISHFAEDPDLNILLATLRCGGLGLNLTMASRVIMVDPWWNEASEQQAFCRVFRIGQKEETYMSRFCVRNSVDAELIAMQERKMREIAEVMEDGGKPKKLSIRDLMRLFGNLNEDEEGKPFILVDNPDPRGGFRADREDEDYADADDG